MTKTLGFIFVLMIALSYSVYSQNINITGKIVNKENNSPVIDARISLIKDNKAIYNAITDSSGRFAIPQTLSLQCDSIKVHAFNYDDYKIEKKNTRDDLGIIRLIPRNIKLKEIVVKSGKRYRDTTKIDLSKKNYERSTMIDDLFSQNLGFSKGKNGQLYYKGKPVNDVLVDGGTFFGKNNMDVYQLLPALTLNGIQIIETNIDSTTNTTSLRPSIKVNLQLKERYKDGKFGNVNIGAGSSQRYLANTNLYSYANSSQFSFILNSNNVNLSQDFILEPTISFSSNGNNQTVHNFKFTFSDIYSKKVEVNFSVQGNLGEKDFVNESNIKFLDENQFSSTVNDSKNNFWGIKNSGFIVNYKVDTLNTFKFTSNFNYYNSKKNDSANYKTLIDNNLTISGLNKYQKSITSELSTQISYEKKFSQKKGSLLNLNLRFSDQHYNLDENDNVLYSNNLASQNYFIDGNRSAIETTTEIIGSFTEPINENSYIKFFTNYKIEKDTYNPNIKSDSLILSSIPIQITNNYFQSGIDFQKTLNSLSFSNKVTFISYSKSIALTNHNSSLPSFYLDLDFNSDYKINSKKSFTLNILRNTNYPNIDQLTNINDTFDLINQTQGNTELKPEILTSAKLNYEFRETDTKSLSVSAIINHYTSKFGYNVSTGVNNIQYQYIDNIGNSNSGTVAFSLQNNFIGHAFFFNCSIGYQEYPEIINGLKTLNNGINYNQSITTTLISTSFLSNSPIFATSFAKYYYTQNSFNVLTITYSDRVSFKAHNLQLNLYPLFNYNHSINNNTSWSVNGEIKKDIFKNLGTIWVQAYDIFNSFKYYNNYLGPNFIESLKYSNVQRYIILGLSFKFSNMK